MFGGCGSDPFATAAAATGGGFGNWFLDLMGSSAGTLLPGLEPFRAHAELPGAWAIFPGPGTVLARVMVLADARIAQVALIGAAGVVPGPRHDPQGRDRIQTVIAGPAWRAPVGQFQAALERHPSLAQALMAHEVAQLHAAWHGLACAALHPVEQRLAQWLLTVAAIAGEAAPRPGEIPVTQASLAALLGLRRTTVTRAMMTLEERGLIRHRRSRVQILDWAGLEHAACECHTSMRHRLASAPAKALENSLAT